jgi:hypothetical protein
MESKNMYRGYEKRMLQRRELSDRRDMIRYEPEKDPRRKGLDRRIEGVAWNTDYYRSS